MSTNSDLSVDRYYDDMYTPPGYVPPPSHVPPSVAATFSAPPPIPAAEVPKIAAPATPAAAAPAAAPTFVGGGSLFDTLGGAWNSVSNWFGSTAPASDNPGALPSYAGTEMRLGLNADQTLSTGSLFKSSYGGAASLGIRGLDATGIADGSYSVDAVRENSQLVLRSPTKLSDGQIQSNGVLRVVGGKAEFLAGAGNGTTLLGDLKSTTPLPSSYTLPGMGRNVDGSVAASLYEAGATMESTTGLKSIKLDKVDMPSGWVRDAYDPKTGDGIFTSADSKTPGAKYWDNSSKLLTTNETGEDSWGKDDWIAISPAIVSLVVGAGSYFLARSQMQQQKKLSDDARDMQLEILGMQYAAASKGGSGGGGGGSSLNIGRILGGK